jgi:hypothetical protein
MDEASHAEPFADQPVIPAGLLALPAEAFVRAAIAELKPGEIPRREITALTEALLKGVNKSRVWAALAARARGGPTPPPPSLPAVLSRPDTDAVVLIETLLPLAPDDDLIFIDEAFHRILGRSAEARDRARIQQALRRGERDRQDVVLELLEQARAEGHDPAVASLGARLGGETPFSLLAGGHAERLVLARRIGDRELLVAEAGVGPAAVPSDGELIVDKTQAGGLILAAPKRTLRSGRWRLAVDLAQSWSSRLCLDVAVNGRTESLLRLTLNGPAVFTAELEARPEHLSLELLLYGIGCDDPDEPWIVRPNEITLTWVGS